MSAEVWVKNNIDHNSFIINLVKWKTIAEDWGHHLNMSSLCLKTLWLSIITFRKFEWRNWHLTCRRGEEYSPNTQWAVTTVPRQLTMGNKTKRDITVPRETLEFFSGWSVCFCTVAIVLYIVYMFRSRCTFLDNIMFSPLLFLEVILCLCVPLRNSHALIHGPHPVTKTLAVSLHKQWCPASLLPNITYHCMASVEKKVKRDKRNTSSVCLFSPQIEPSLEDCFSMLCTSFLLPTHLYWPVVQYVQEWFIH